MRRAGANQAVNAYLRFNSRTREGCDKALALSPMDEQVSIHAPGRGATSLAEARDLSAYRFNSRTREGCDLTNHNQTKRLCLFQFTHPGGVRHLAGQAADIVPAVSIHAPGRGATPAFPRVRPSLGRFNSRTREGCDELASRRR